MNGDKAANCITINFSPGDSLIEKIRAQAKKDERPASSFCRRIIREWFLEHEAKR